jgi:uncharacterized glyoxalase superfamily protein PhnB/uncharacterized protein YndB with AHSA1/START domain
MPALSVTRTMSLPAAMLFRAWTTGWGAWFADADSAQCPGIVGAPFFFEVTQRFTDGRAPIRHPHYGRILRLEPDALVSMTWMTGAAGTGGAETTLTVQLDAVDAHTTRVTLTQTGFTTTGARDDHELAWPPVLAHLEQQLVARPLPLPPVVIPDATFTPVRSYPDVDAAVHWLREVLGAQPQQPPHAHRVALTVGNGTVVVVAWDATAHPATGGRPPAVLMVRVPDVDAAYARAVALGAEGLAPPADHPDGDRQATVRDPAGHAWTLTHRQS